MKIDIAIFQEMESFGKEKLFKIAMEKFLIFVWENSEISENGYNALSCKPPYIYIVCSFYYEPEYVS